MSPVQEAAEGRTHRHLAEELVVDFEEIEDEMILREAELLLLEELETGT